MSIACFVMARYPIPYHSCLTLIKQTRAYSFYFNEQTRLLYSLFGVFGIIAKSRDLLTQSLCHDPRSNTKNRKWQTIKQKRVLKQFKVKGCPNKASLGYSCCIVNCTDSLFLGGSYMQTMKRGPPLL